VLVVLYPDDGLLNSKTKRWCRFYVFALNLILYKHVEVAIKWLHQKNRNLSFPSSIDQEKNEANCRREGPTAH